MFLLQGGVGKRWGRKNPVWNKMRQILNETGYPQVVEGESGVWYD